MSENPDKTDFGFREVAPAEKTRLVREVFASVAPNYDVMNDLMSFGVHRLWKRWFVATSGVKRGDRCLDLAGGTGDIAALLAKAVGPEGEVVLTDINAAMLGVGRDRLFDRGIVGNVRTSLADASALPFASARFDLVTIAFGLRNVTDKLAALREMRRVLKAGGRALVLEFTPDVAAPLKPISICAAAKSGSEVAAGATAKPTARPIALSTAVRTMPRLSTSLPMTTPPTKKPSVFSV